MEDLDATFGDTELCKIRANFGSIDRSRYQA